MLRSLGRALAIGATTLTVAGGLTATSAIAATPPAAALTASATTAVSVVAYTGANGVPYTKRSDSTQWTSLGGALADAPAVAAAAGRVIYVGRGTTNRLYVRTDSSGWTPFASSTARCYQPSIAVSAATLVVACRGGNSHLWMGTATLGSGNPYVTSWKDLGGSIVAAGVDVEDGGWTFGVTGSVYGPDGENTYVYDQRDGWDRLGLACATHPTMALAGGIGYLTCNGGVDGLLYMRVDTNTTSTAPSVKSAGGRLVGAPAVAVLSDGSSATVYLAGTDRIVRSITIDATGVHGWQRLSTASATQPSVGAAQVSG